MSNLIKVELPASCGEGQMVEVDTAKFADHIIAALVAHGVKQKLADACAGDKKAGVPMAESKEAALAVLEALYAGTWAKRGGARINTEAAYMDSEAAKVAKARIAKDEKLAVKPAYMVKLGKDAWLAHVTKAYRGNADMQAQWAKEWGVRKVAKEDIDLGDLI
ncbi:MAG: hypothetical protein C0436_04925 [Alphaproteobacteria bacterium]|nr:hypothetical protein [Alphaproteobacteria bacterium]